MAGRWSLNSNKNRRPIIKSFTQIQRTAWSLTALLLLMVSNVVAADNGFERALLPLL